MDQQTQETLEIGALKELLARHIQTPMGRGRVTDLRATRERAQIERALDLTSECRQYLADGEQFSLAGIEDPEPALSALKVEGISLTPQQIVALERLVTTAMDARERFRTSDVRLLYPGLAELALRVPDLRPLIGGVRGKVLPDGEIDDNASPELRLIRRELQVFRARIHRHLESIMRLQARAVQEELITFRNERFVIPVRTDARGQVPGVVHGLSSSGQTTYVEPLAVIDQNNELVRLREKEQVEIAHILMSLTELFRSNIGGVREAAQVLTELDLSQAKALLSSEFACARPRMSDGLRLSLREARHILLEYNLRKSGAGAVPISLELDERNRVLVVSGPNAGGKTVVLKTVGLISLMAQMGLHVPAAEAELPIFDRVFADIGDQQSIAANLSTFTAHMRNVSQMARLVAPPALVLIDEVGTGTDPDEGAALAIAIVDYFRRSGATTVATTHYNQLKMWASSAPGVVNASVEFDERTLEPTYRLILGIAGASSGLYIAERMNVPEAIVEGSRALLDPRHIEAGNYLKQIKAKASEIEELRRSLDAERADLAKERAELEHDYARKEEARREEFDKTLAGIAGEFRAESERLISGLEDRILAERMRKAASQRALSLRRKGSELREKAGAGILAGSGGARDAPIAGLYEPREGDRVKVITLDKQGTVESVHDGTYTVVIGPLRFRAKRDELAPAPAAPPGPASKPSRPAPAVPVDAEEEFVREINVIGMTADEATERVDKFIDAAFFAGVESVRIIHGHGKGVLRRAIARLLTGHQQVQSFQPAPPNQGGSGATVVDLRK